MEAKSSKKMLVTFTNLDGVVPQKTLFLLILYFYNVIHLSSYIISETENKVGF
jgi:hypothetical protein